MSGDPRAARFGEMASLDETDWRLIELLRADGRMPFRALADELGVAETAVRARVRALESSGCMKVVAVALNWVVPTRLPLRSSGFSMPEPSRT